MGRDFGAVVQLISAAHRDYIPIMQIPKNLN
jgi:hypothetical protein